MNSKDLKSSKESSSNEKDHQEKTRTMNFSIMKAITGRLLTSLLIVYLSQKSYSSFLENENELDQFMDRLELKRLLVDYKFVDADQKCPGNYTEIDRSYFKIETNQGCQCDGKIFESQICNQHINKLNIKDLDESNCNDKFLLNNTQPSYNSSTDNYTCIRCFRNLPTEKLIDNLEDYNLENFTLEYYFRDGQKFCLKYSSSISTLTYLTTINYEKCNIENQCNYYFCKLGNNNQETCPLIYFDWGYTMNDSHSPIVFSSDFRSFKDYDSDSIPIINLPIIDIKITRNGGCINGKTKFIPNYPTMTKEDCVESDRYYQLKSQTLNDVLDFNNLTARITKPYFSSYSKDDVWKIELETAVNRKLLYCLQTNTSSYITLANITNPESISESNAIKNKFAALLTTFTGLRFNVNVSKTNQLVLLLFTTITAVYSFLIFISYLILYFCFSKEEIKASKKKNINCFLILGISNQGKTNLEEGQSRIVIAEAYSYVDYIIYFLNMFIRISKYVTQVIDWFILLLTFYTYFELKSFYSTLKTFIDTECLDSLSKDSFTTFRLMINDVMNQCLELMLMISSRLFITLCSLIYYFLYNKKVSFSDLMNICFEDEKAKELADKKKKMKIDCAVIAKIKVNN